MSQLQRINDLNYIAGNHPVADWAAIERQLKLIDLEFNELRRAVAERNIEQIRDGIADVIVTAGGLGHRMGISTENDLAEVVDCLYTRFDITPADQLLTAAKYLSLGVETYCHAASVVVGGISKDYYVTKVAHNCVGTNGEAYPAHKWLKSIRTVSPTFKGPTVFDAVSRAPKRKKQTISEKLGRYIGIEDDEVPN